MKKTFFESVGYLKIMSRSIDSKPTIFKVSLIVFCEVYLSNMLKNECKNKQRKTVLENVKRLLSKFLQISNEPKIKNKKVEFLKQKKK